MFKTTPTGIQFLQLYPLMNEDTTYLVFKAQPNDVGPK
jgi:hypothetical protein